MAREFKTPIDTTQVTGLVYPENGTDAVNKDYVDALQSTTYLAEFPYSKVGEETLTGKRHPVSDKPIYTQSYYIADIGTTYDGTIVTGLTGYDDIYILDYISTRTDGSSFSNSRTYHLGDISEFLAYPNADGDIVYNTGDGAGNTNASILVILEYTKTADTSSSPIVTTAISTQHVYPEVGIEKLTNKRHPVSLKPVYTQSYYIADIGTTYDGYIVTGLTGYDDIYILDYITTRTDGSVFSTSRTYYVSETSEYLASITLDGDITYSMGDIAISNNASILVTIEYTKTADTITSPINSLVATASHPYPEIGIEKLTGKRYPVSSKPVYIQAFYIADIGTTYDALISTGLTGIDLCWIESHQIKLTTGSMSSASGSYYYGDTTEVRTSCEADGSSYTYNISDGASSNNASVLVVLEYTKTADTSSSPISSTALESPKLMGDVNINNEYTLPSTDGTDTQVLTTDGSGNTSWGTPSSGISADEAIVYAIALG